MSDDTRVPVSFSCERCEPLTFLVIGEWRAIRRRSACARRCVCVCARQLALVFGCAKNFFGADRRSMDGFMCVSFVSHVEISASFFFQHDFENRYVLSAVLFTLYMQLGSCRLTLTHTQRGNMEHGMFAADSIVSGECMMECRERFISNISYAAGRQLLAGLFLTPRLQLTLMHQQQK